MFKYRRTLKISFIVLVVLVSLYYPVRALTVSNGDQLSYAFLLKDKTFSVKWIHSVEKEEWIEFFKVSKQTIYLDSTKFKTFGAGVPSYSEKPTRLKDGWVYMDVDRKIGSELIVRSTSINDYQLKYNGNRYPLKPSDNAYIVEVKKVPLLHIIWTYMKEIVG